MLLPGLAKGEKSNVTKENPTVLTVSDKASHATTVFDSIGRVAPRKKMLVVLAVE